MFIALLVAAALLLVFALAVRFAGANRVLNFVEYAKVRDLPALHAWVGNRLLGLAATTGVLGLLALRAPASAIFCLLGFVAIVMATVGWLVVGTGRFQTPGKER